MGLLATVRSLPEALKISVQGTSAEFSDTVTDFLVGDCSFSFPTSEKYPQSNSTILHARIVNEAPVVSVEALEILT
jgi:hypothetical protein